MRVLLIILMLLMPSIAGAKEVTLSMAYTNAVGKKLPFDLFKEGKWAPDPQARFVKLHMYFDEPIPIRTFQIVNCGKKLDPYVTVFINFDQWILNLDENLEGAVPPALYPRQKGNILELTGISDKVEVRSLTWNFEYNSGFSICGMNLVDHKGQPHSIKVPRIVQGSAKADSTLKPHQAYGIMNLFDSRFEYGWASNGKNKNVALDFNFQKKQRVEQIRIWNGYQRSVKHCFENARAKTILVTGDGGYKATIKVKDQLGAQLITLPKPFKGKNLKMKVIDSYPGKTYKDLVISELRFYDGKEWFLMDPLPKMKKDIAQNRSQFKKTRLDQLLNDGFAAYDEMGEPVMSLRLRADGSFYLSGYYADEKRESMISYFTLGNYQVKKVDGKRIKLRLFGLYYESEVYGDCNGCGRDCNTAKGDDSAGGKIFQEYVVLSPSEDGVVKISNLSGGKKLKFKVRVLRREIQP